MMLCLQHWFGIHGSPNLIFRALSAATLALLLTWRLAPPVIAALRRWSLDPNKSDSPQLRQLHAGKSATPTMGGLFVVAALVMAVLVCGDLSRAAIQQTIVLLLGLAGLGVLDDLVKLRSTRNGLSARSKFLLQVLLVTMVTVWAGGTQSPSAAGACCDWPWTTTTLTLGAAFLPLAVFVVVGASNAVNLTDGLDGLATGCLLPATLVMTGAALAGDENSAEVAIAGAALLGGLLGFLRFNRHPARVFMGDTGSLPLGGLLGWLAIVARQEWLLAVVGGVFVVEALSVVLQVGSWKLRHKRVFRCAPLHHHFQFLGWPEPRIVQRFWMAGVACAVVGGGLLFGVRHFGAGPRGGVAPSAALIALEPAGESPCPLSAR